MATSGDPPDNMAKPGDPPDQTNRLEKLNSLPDGSAMLDDLPNDAAKSGDHVAKSGDLPDFAVTLKDLPHCMVKLDDPADDVTTSISEDLIQITLGDVEECGHTDDKLKTEGSQRAISDPYTNGDEGEPDKFKTEIPEEVTSCPHTLDEEGKLKPSEKPKTATDPHVGKIRKEAEQWTVIEEVIDKGLVLKMKSKEPIIASFTYALWPEVKNVTTTSWELLATDIVMQSQNICCHKLQAGDHLPKLIAHYQNNHSVALIIVNTRNDYTIDKSFLGEMEGVTFPVVILTQDDGVHLLKTVEIHLDQEDDILVRIMSKSTVHRTQFLNAISAETVFNHDSGTKQPHKHKEYSVDLKVKLKKIIFRSKQLLVVSESESIFCQVMECLYDFEKQPKERRNNVGKAIKKLRKHCHEYFDRDFPFYIVLGYCMHLKSDIYSCEDLTAFNDEIIQKTESLQPQELADTLHNFVQRSDFYLKFAHRKEQEYNTVYLFREACVVFRQLSKHLRSDQKNMVYSHMMWIIIGLKLRMAGTAGFNQKTKEMWKRLLLKDFDSISFDADTLAGLKQGLMLWKDLQLPHFLTMDTEFILKLFFPNDQVLPFYQLTKGIHDVDPFLTDFILFEGNLRNIYHHWIMDNAVVMLEPLSRAGTVTGALNEGLHFLQILCSKMRFRNLKLECRNSLINLWLNLLIGLVDVRRGDASEHLQILFPTHTKCSDVVVKDFRTHIQMTVTEMTEKNNLSIQAFYPLFKAVKIWTTEFLTRYFACYVVPPRINLYNTIWNDFIQEIISRFPFAHQHKFLLNFLRSVSKCYAVDNRGDIFIIDLFRLNAKLFSSKGGTKDDIIRAQFVSFLSLYIDGYDLKFATLRHLPSILDIISTESSDFQQLILQVLHKEIIPECKSLQGEETLKDTSLQSMLEYAIMIILSSDLSWKTNITIKQNFCWGFVATYCSKVPLYMDNLDWINSYLGLVCQLCTIYSKITARQSVHDSDQHLMLTSAPNEKVYNYIKWVFRIRNILLLWEEKFNRLQVNYDDVFYYANNQSEMIKLGKAVCSQSIVSAEKVIDLKRQLEMNVEKLNKFLICYVPGKPEAGYCKLQDILLEYDVTLPPVCVHCIRNHIQFPDENKCLAADLLVHHVQSSTTGSFQLHHDHHLRLTQEIRLKELHELVNELSTFLTPFEQLIKMLVYFKLFPSEIFRKYMHYNLQKETACQGRKEDESTIHPITHGLPLSTLPGHGTVDALKLESSTKLIAALSQTRTMLVKLVQGTATFKEIILEGDLNLMSLDTDVEFGTLAVFFKPSAEPQALSEGLIGIKSMLELFQYQVYIETIDSVCKQFMLQGCLGDDTLLRLRKLAKRLKSDDTWDEMTPLQAAEQLRQVKEDLCLKSRSHFKSLELFESVRNNSVFYQFVQGEKFVGAKGHARFLQQYGLITAQLQHEVYEESVLNHLYAAFHVIEPFIDTTQIFQKLMHRVTALDTTSGLKQLDTVNSNISLIRLWFSRAEGDTLQNVASELECILNTGFFIIKMTPESSCSKILLRYCPSTTSNASSGHDSLSLGSKTETWSREQINDFVTKLGFFDAEKEGSIKRKHFLYIHEIAHKLLERYIKLRELGYPENLFTARPYLHCNISRENADKMVMKADGLVSTWVQLVAKHRREHQWLLFLQVPKIINLYEYLHSEEPLANVQKVIHELSFLCINTAKARDDVCKRVKGYLTECEMNKEDSPMLVVGHFLDTLFKDHQLPQRSRQKAPGSSQLANLFLHSCPEYDQKQLVQLIVNIYKGVPESFEVFHCRPNSTEEQLSLFLKRAESNIRRYLVLEVNKLPLKLQEYLMQEHLAIQRRVRKQSEELKFFSHTSAIHFIETAPTVLQEIPFEKDSTFGRSMTFDMACDIWRKTVKDTDFTCIELVYGHAGDGKTHYIKQCLMQCADSITIAVNEGFTPLKAIRKLNTLPFTQEHCAVYFNFTMLPPGDSVDDSELQHYHELVQIIGWFFFDLLILGYVEDPETSLSFHLPGDLLWAVYVEVPSQDLNMDPGDALKHFIDEIPTLGLVGAHRYIQSDEPYMVDNDVQLVCKYLLAYRSNEIDTIHEELHHDKLPGVKFSTKKDLTNKECQHILLQNMPPHVKHSKITQRLFVKYMKRRCEFIDKLPAFNYNIGVGELIENEWTDTSHLGSTLMKTMLQEVTDFCDPDIKENWSLKPHQQLIYDFCDGGSSIGLLSLYPNKLPKEDKLNFEKIGVKMPNIHELATREVLDNFLGRALNIRLESNRLSPIDDAKFILTLDYTIKMLNIHERSVCGVPVIIEGETGVGKTALIEMLSKLWNHSLLDSWKMKQQQLLYHIHHIQRKLKDLELPAESYSACVEAVGRISAGDAVEEKDLLLVCQLPDPDSTSDQIYFTLRRFLLEMWTDPAISILTLEESKVSLKELFEQAEKEDSAKVTASLYHAILTARIPSTFYKINVHAAMTCEDIKSELIPAFEHAQQLWNANAERLKHSIPSITVFFDEINTSSCLGLFKEIIVDRSFDGEPIPENIFIVAACNPHHGNSLASLEKGTWVRNSYYVRQLHPTLQFLKWNYGSLDGEQEKEYINAKMTILNSDPTDVEVLILTDLIVTSQQCMRLYSCDQLRSRGFSRHKADILSRSCVSQRDIQRVFTFYQWLMDTYEEFKWYDDPNNERRRALLVALGIVYYMRLDEDNRIKYQMVLGKQSRRLNNLKFKEAFDEELDRYMSLFDVPNGIAKTQALKENVFATMICAVTRTPLIIIGAPGSSKTLSFNLVIANLKGQESKNEIFRQTKFFCSLDPQCYQCSRKTTSNEIQTVFSRAINRQKTHSNFSLPVYCIVFMDEAGLPEESHESLKVLHYHLDRQEVPFVAITNHVLDAAKSNRAVSLYRSDSSEDDLNKLAQGCYCSKPESLPEEVVSTIKGFCSVYVHLMNNKAWFNQFFGLRDFIHFMNYLRRQHSLDANLVLEALERNFNGSDHFKDLCTHFLFVVKSDLKMVTQRSMLKILKDSLEDHPHKHGLDVTENEVRYKLIIDPSEDDSLIRFLFLFGVFDRENTRMFVCGDFPGDDQNQKINTIAAIRHSAVKGHTVIMSQTDDIHECFYDLFNQRFRRIDGPHCGVRNNPESEAHADPQSRRQIDPQNRAYDNPQSGPQIDPQNGAQADPGSGPQIDPQNAAQDDAQSGPHIDPQNGGAQHDQCGGPQIEPQNGVQDDQQSGPQIDPQNGAHDHQNKSHDYPPNAVQIDPVREDPHSASQVDPAQHGSQSTARNNPHSGPRYFTNIAIGAHVKPCRVDPDFQCIIVVKKNEIKNIPAPFLNRFEKYCISHHTLLYDVLNQIPMGIRIIIQAAIEKVSLFIGLVDGSTSLYGLKENTLDSLVLTILPPKHHTFQTCKYNITGSKHIVIDSDEDIQVFFLNKLLQAIQHSAGFRIPTWSHDCEEICLDAQHIFELVRRDPEFDGLISTLKNHCSTVTTAINEAMRVLHIAQGSEGSGHQEELSPTGCLVVSLFQQWLIHHLCKQLMQLMTPEALVLNRKKLPVSYIINYIKYQKHFSLKSLINEHFDAIGCVEERTTKLLCYTRSSPFLHELPSQYPNHLQDSSDHQRILQKVVFSDVNKLMMCKISSISSQSAVRELLSSFIYSETPTYQVLLLIASMPEASRSMINHLRIMIEEVENEAICHSKLFVLLIQFPPANLFDACYPSLFLHGWNHFYLDTIAHGIDRGMGVVDICDWFLQCCSLPNAPQCHAEDSLVQTLLGLLPEVIPILLSRVNFGMTGGPFSHPMNGSERTKVLNELLNHKGIGQALCIKFRARWQRTVMEDYLERAALFSKNHKSTLSMTDSIQTMFKNLFFDFLVYMISRMNDNFELDILFGVGCPLHIEKLFISILNTLFCPELSQLKARSNTLPLPQPLTYSPQFPFFLVVAAVVDKLVEESCKEVNKEFNFLKEEDEEKANIPHPQHQLTIAEVLQKAVIIRINDFVKKNSKSSLSLTLKAMNIHNDLWLRYFKDFRFHRLHLDDEGISKQVLEAYFGQLHKVEPVHRIVILHVNLKVNKLDLAKITSLLRPLIKLQSSSKSSSCSPSFPTVMLGTKEYLTEFVINTLFNALIDSYNHADKTWTELSTWYHSYCDILVMPAMKEYIYNRLTPDTASAAVETRLNIMHAIYVCLQTKPRLDDNILHKAQNVFQTFSNQHSVEKFVCPRLEEVTHSLTSILYGISFSTSLYEDNKLVQVLVGRLLAHYFSAHRPGFHSEDVQYFLQLTNVQLHWQVASTDDETHAKGGISIHLFKFYLMHILGECNEDVDSGPLKLFNGQIRRMVGDNLTVTSLGEPGPYIPIFYQQYSAEVQKLSKNKLMQQPLAHLYFLTVLECLIASMEDFSVLFTLVKKVKQHNETTIKKSEQVLLMIELQALVQVVIQQVALQYHPTDDSQVRTLTPLLHNLNKLLEDSSIGGGEAGGHGMVLALHILRHIQSSRRFYDLFSDKFDSLCSGIKCLHSIHNKLNVPSVSRAHCFPFMHQDGGDRTELRNLYQNISRAMLDIHKERSPDELVQIAKSCCCTNKSHHFRMMVWLNVYYEFFVKGIESKPLYRVVEKELVPFLKEERYICLVKCFLDCKDMIKVPEPPNPVRDDEQVLELGPDGLPHTRRRSGELCDPLHELFMPNKKKQQDQFDIDLKHSIANLIAVVLGCPAASNHLWYHMFAPEKLPGTYMTGFMYNSPVKPNSLFYDCGVELSPEGTYGRQDYLSHANRGTYTLHSLYLILWANFAALSVSLLTQPGATEKIHGTVISNWLSIRHYCVSQLRTVWLHIRNNLGISDEERSFFIMRCMKKLFEHIHSDAVDAQNLIGLYSTSQEVDSCETMWHNCVYKPCWDELQVKFVQYSENQLLKDLKQLEKYYPNFPSEEDFTRSVLSVGALKHHVDGGDLRFLSLFVTEWPRLQAGDLLLHDLVKLYLWLHNTLAHLVTRERAERLTIGEVIHLAAKSYSKEERDLLTVLYKSVKANYNKYLTLIGGAIGAGPCAALRQGNKVYTIDDDMSLLHFLSETEDEEGGNDWLYAVIAHIISIHNSFIEGLSSMRRTQPDSALARLLPNEPTFIYPAEFNEHHAIVGNFLNFHDINDYLQIIRSRYPSPSNVPSYTTSKPELSLSYSLQNTSTFALTQVQEAILTEFVAGKPLIYEPSCLRKPFKFKQHQPTSTSNPTDVATSSLELEEISSNLPENFKLGNGVHIKNIEFQFHTANYHSLMEVVTAMKTVARHLTKCLNESSPNTDLSKLEQLTVPAFMLTLYREITDSSKVMEAIGIHSQTLTVSQFDCIINLPLTGIFSCLQMFVQWISDGTYDFCSLPVSHKAKLSRADQAALQEIPQKWHGSIHELFVELQQMNEVLGHSEADICKAAVDTSVVQYLKNIQMIADEDCLPALLPSTICLQHYVSLRLQLRKLVSQVQEQLTEQQCSSTDDTQLKCWPEFVADLWHQRLPHMRLDSYAHDETYAYDPLTEKYGFQAGFEERLTNGAGTCGEQEEALAHTFSVEPVEIQESGSKDDENKDRGVEAEEEMSEEETGEEVGEDFFIIVPSEDHEEEVPSPEDVKPKYTPAMIEKASTYGVDDVVEFLCSIGLGDRYTTSFTEEEITGDFLLEADHETLDELGVDSQDQQEILSQFWNRMEEETKLSVEAVQTFLEEYKFSKYSETFRSHLIDGDRLMVADDNMLKDLGVSSAIDRKKIITKFRQFVKN